MARAHMNNLAICKPEGKGIKFLITSQVFPHFLSPHTNHHLQYSHLTCVLKISEKLQHNQLTHLQINEIYQIYHSDTTFSYCAFASFAIAWTKQISSQSKPRQKNLGRACMHAEEAKKMVTRLWLSSASASTISSSGLVGKRAVPVLRVATHGRHAASLIKERGSPPCILGKLRAPPLQCIRADGISPGCWDGIGAANLGEAVGGCSASL
jgi:hypothetical protein